MSIFSGMRNVQLAAMDTVQTKKDEWIEVEVPLDKFEATSEGSSRMPLG